MLAEEDGRLSNEESGPVRSLFAGMDRRELPLISLSPGNSDCDVSI